MRVDFVCRGCVYMLQKFEYFLEAVFFVSKTDRNFENVSTATKVKSFFLFHPATGQQNLTVIPH